MKCDLKTLLNLSQTNKTFFELVQKPIFSSHEITYNKKIKKYNIHLMTRIKNEHKINDNDLQKLPYLTFLYLRCNDKITNKGIKYLYNLTKLNLCENDKITERY